MTISRYTMFVEELEIPDEIIKPYFEATPGEQEAATQAVLEEFISTIPDRKPPVLSSLVMYLPPMQEPV